MRDERTARRNLWPVFHSAPNDQHQHTFTPHCSRKLVLLNMTQLTRLLTVPSTLPPPPSRAHTTAFSTPSANESPKGRTTRTGAPVPLYDGAKSSTHTPLGRPDSGQVRDGDGDGAGRGEGDITFFLQASRIQGTPSRRRIRGTFRIHQRSAGGTTSLDKGGRGRVCRWSETR